LGFCWQKPISATQQAECGRSYFLPAEIIILKMLPIEDGGAAGSAIEVLNLW